MSSLTDDLAGACIDREAPSKGPGRAAFLRAIIRAASRMLREDVGLDEAIGIHSSSIRELHEKDARRGVRNV